jgi:hypothetical protein
MLARPVEAAADCARPRVPQPSERKRIGNPDRRRMKRNMKRGETRAIFREMSA